MKAIRRSLKNNNEKDKSPAPRSSHQSKPSLHHKSAVAIIPPKKVIKALYDYSPTNKNSNELAFEKGDFFHVISREDDTEWYEACNPLKPHAKGLVPVAFFEVVEKQQRQSSQSTSSGTAHDSGFSERGLSAGLVDPMPLPVSKPTMVSKPVMHSRGPSTSRAGAMVYGVVLYDFQAERPDELEAKANEAIIVVAQSNPEWFVAKPIGRLGGPGLIPVSFVSIRDTHTGEVITDPLAAVKAAGVPRVEEWKRTAAEYKNSSISLGQINTPQIGGAQQVTQQMGGISLQPPPKPQAQMQMQMQQKPRMQQQEPPPPSQRQVPQQEQLLAPIKASVPRYCFDHDTYWYIIEAQLSDGRWWELARYYADFYDFQIALLEKFPAEAGNTGKPRTLPFMPGPVAHVTDAISNGRRQNLDEYIKKIVALPPYIREDVLVRKLFAPKPGHDYEIDPEAVEDDYRLSGHSLAQTQSRQSSGATSSQQNSTYNMPPPPPTASQRSLNGTHVSRPSQGQNGMPPPPLHTQASNLTTNSTGSGVTPPVPKAAPGPTMKVKVEWANDILVLRTPENATFEEFSSLVRNRVQVIPGVNIAMKYRDDMKGTTVPLTSDEELRIAMGQRNFRLVVETV